ncbi:MAG: conserved rane protein of unknown function [Modestobacter sp.]|nr:conserved rane protein of unknown function [Modestobacter sp.]
MYPRGPACPVCGAEVLGLPAAPCPSCGLPAAGQAGWVVGRIGATLEELTRDRDALLATLRAAAPGAPTPAAARAPLDAAWAPPVPAPPTPPAAPGPPAPWWPAALEQPPAQPRRRLSPQQVLLALGALLLVAGALAFVALGWTRFGLVFQATVMVTVTAAAGGTSAWAARRGLRATEEALAAAGTALLVVDLGAARARGLGGLDDVPLRTWTAVCCLAVVLVALGLNRFTRSTTTWPVAALLAAQPVPLLLLSSDLVWGPAGVATALVVAAADLPAGLVLRPGIARGARLLAALWAGVGVLGGLLLAGAGTAAESWTATALLTAAGGGAVAALREPRLAGARLRVEVVAAAAAGVAGLALTGSLDTAGPTGAVVATGLGLLLLTAAALASGAAPLTGRLPGPAVPAARGALHSAGTAMAAVGALLLGTAEWYGPLSLLVLAAAVPAALSAIRLPRVREVCTGGALLSPVLAVSLAREAGWFSAPTAGLLLALVAAGAFALATVRAGAAEEWVCAAAGAGAGAVAGLTTGGAGAWGQVGLQLAVVGVAAGCYAVVAHRPPVAVAAVADLVLACWIAVAGAGVETAEAYTLPAAVGLLVVAWPRLRAGVPSWAAEGAAAGVALVPSALAVAASPSALRLVLVVAGAVVLVVVGTLLHRQAPFVLGACALAFVVVTRLGPYAPLLPTWVTLAAAGLLLLVLGATYERRLQQAREAVAWVAQLS